MNSGLAVRMKQKVISVILLLCMLLLVIALSSAKPKSLLLNVKSVDKELKMIPSGSFSMLNCTSGKCNWDSVSVTGFYAWPFEISNGIYRQYIAGLKMMQHESRWQSAYPDTTVWRNKPLYLEPFASYYFSHPAYSAYPVVGITQQQCFDFCEWLTEKYHQLPNRKFKNVVFDLPTETEWMYMACAGLHQTSFPWGGSHLRNANGLLMANFTVIPQESVMNIDSAGKTIFRLVTQKEPVRPFTMPEYDEVTAPVKSYWPNNWGMYNMSGNVEEFVKEPGISKGGSWADGGYFLRIWSKQYYETEHSASRERGFRVIMRVIEK